MTASLRNRGVAPPYYALALRLEYPCPGGSANTSSTLVPLNQAVLVPRLDAINVRGVIDVSPTLVDSAGTHALCVSLASPMARKPVKFAVNGVGEDGRVLALSV
eukprot:COSAG03_NODE_873_length_5533_cov_76.535149_3_plen_104_part_00